jgi:hypothetical protein
MTKKSAGKLAGNNEPQNPIENETVTTVARTRGRQKGVSTGQTQKVYIEIIPNKLRIDISDGINKTVQEFVTRTRMNDSKPEDEIHYKQGDTYTDWSNVDKCFWSTYKQAFNRIHDILTDEDAKTSAKNRTDKEIYISMSELKNSFDKKLKWLDEMFKSDFVDDEVVSKPKYVKKIEDKGKK